MRVLIIDDEPDVLLLCRVNFEFAGHEVLEALDAERGLETATQAHPDVIILDVMLPRKDGFTLLRELQERSDTADIPVVLLTARTQTDDRLRGFRSGADEYVTKPFSPTAFVQTVQRVCSMSLDDRRRRREAIVATLTGSRA